jgi:hypothetical protein
MKELSHRLMVTGGNVTGITDQLVTEGLVERMGVDGDRRAFRVRLTRATAAPASSPWRSSTSSWIVEAFDGLSARDLDSLHKLLGKVKQHQTRTQPADRGMKHPRRASRDPLQGAMPTARQSRFRGIPGQDTCFARTLNETPIPDHNPMRGQYGAHGHEIAPATSR